MRCSDPEAGLDEPAISMAMPLRMRPADELLAIVVVGDVGVVLEDGQRGSFGRQAGEVVELLGASIVRLAPVANRREVGDEVTKARQPGPRGRRIDDVHVDHDGDRHLGAQRLLAALGVEDDGHRGADGIAGQLRGHGHDLRLPSRCGQLGHVDHSTAPDRQDEVGLEAIDHLDHLRHRCLAVGRDEAGLDGVAGSAGVRLDATSVAGRGPIPAVHDEEAMARFDEVRQSVHDRLRPAHDTHQARDADRAMGRDRDAHRVAAASSSAVTCSARR